MTYALSFYRSQNNLAGPNILFQTKNWIVFSATPNFCAGTKTKCSKCKSSFGLAKVHTRIGLFKPSKINITLISFDKLFGEKTSDGCLLKQIDRWKFAFSEALNFSSNYNVHFFISHFAFRRQPAEFFFSIFLVKWKQVKWQMYSNAVMPEPGGPGEPQAPPPNIWQII